MTTKHTPGPWTVRYAFLGPFVTAPNQSASEEHHITIAATNREQLGAFYAHQAEANARLIAAAPDLLAALRGLLAAVHADHPSLRDFDYPESPLTIARAAIAKAEGQS